MLRGHANEAQLAKAWERARKRVGRGGVGRGALPRFPSVQASLPRLLVAAARLPGIVVVHRPPAGPPVKPVPPLSRRAASISLCCLCRFSSPFSCNSLCLSQSRRCFFGLPPAPPSLSPPSSFSPPRSGRPRACELAVAVPLRELTAAACVCVFLGHLIATNTHTHARIYALVSRAGKEGGGGRVRLMQRSGLGSHLVTSSQVFSSHPPCFTSPS